MALKRKKAGRMQLSCVSMSENLQKPFADKSSMPVSKAMESIEDDLKRIIKLEKDVSEEKIKLYKELKEASKEKEVPVTLDNGEVIERTGIFSLKKIKGESKPIEKGAGLSFKDKYNLKNHPTQTFFIEMFFSNGTVKEWVLKSKEEVFAYKGRMYYLRHENVWYHVTRNQHKLYFHEDFVCPIDRKVLQQGDKEFFSVTPMNIKPLLAMEYVKALVAGDSLTKWLKFCLLLSAFCAILSIVTIAILLKKGG